MASMGPVCPDCCVPIVVDKHLIGGWVKGRCLQHGDRLVGPPTPTARARTSDPATSHAAAASIDPRNQQEQLLRALIRIGHANRWEISRESGLTEYQAGRRLSELQQAGLIVWTGELRPGETGRMQTVWAITQAGHRWLLGPEGAL